MVSLRKVDDISAALDCSWRQHLQGSHCLKYEQCATPERAQALIPHRPVALLNISSLLLSRTRSSACKVTNYQAIIDDSVYTLYDALLQPAPRPRHSVHRRSSWFVSYQFISHPWLQQADLYHAVHCKPDETYCPAYAGGGQRCYDLRTDNNHCEYRNIRQVACADNIWFEQVDDARHIVTPDSNV